MGLTSCAYNVDVEYERGFLDEERPELTHSVLFPFWDKEKAVEQLNAILKHSKVIKAELIYDGEVLISKIKRNKTEREVTFKATGVKVMGEKETDIGRAVVGFRLIHQRLIALAADFNRVVDENYEQLSSASETRDDINQIFVHFGLIGELLSKYTLKDK